MALKRKAISPVISTAILVATTILLTMTFALYLSGIQSGYMEKSLPGEMRLDQATCNATLLTAYVRNVGKGAITVLEVYMNGLLVDASKISQIPTPLPEDTIATLKILGPFDVGKDYDVKLVGTDSSQLLFSVRCM